MNDGLDAWLKICEENVCELKIIEVVLTTPTDARVFFYVHQHYEHQCTNAQR